MTTQEKQNYIQEKAIEANPSIKDLVFGCEIETITDRLPQTRGRIVLIETEGEKYYVISSEEFGVIGNYFEGEFNILGRPIRLADVLLAIAMIEEGQSPVGYDENVRETVRKWKLLEDTLSDQFPETIDFIYELLK